MSKEINLLDLVNSLNFELKISYVNKSNKQINFTNTKSTTYLKSVVIEIKPNVEYDSIVSLYNPVKLTPIVVLAEHEIRFFENLDNDYRSRILDELFGRGRKWIVFCEQSSIPDYFLEKIGDKPPVVSVTSVSAFTLIRNINRFLELSTNATGEYVHGVFMDVLGLGVLLTGMHNIGKSELALELVSRGHSLVADDSPELYKINETTLVGKSPRVLYEFLEVRGLGVLNVRAMFGDNAIKDEVILKLIIHLEKISADEIDADHRLHGNIDTRILLNTTIDCISLPVAPGRNLAVLVETAVRNYHLQLKGYNSANEFIKRQRQSIGDNKE